MKVVLSALLALSLVAGAVEAKPAKKKAARAKAAKQTRVTLPPKAQAVSDVTVAPAASAAAQEQTSSATISETVAQQAPKKWSMLIDIWAEGNINGVNRSGDKTTVRNENNGSAANTVFENTVTLRPTYKVTDIASASVGIDIVHSFGSVDGSDGGYVTPLDLYLQAAHSKIALAGPVTLKSYIRPYLPTSEASANEVSGRYLAVRAGLTAGMPLGNGIELSYNAEPRYYFQKNKTFLKKQDDSSFEYAATENYRLKHWLGLSFESGRLSGYQNLGMRTRVYHQDQDVDTGATLTAPQKDELYVETGLGYQIVDNFALNGGFYTETNNFRNNNGWTVYNDTAYFYFVEGVVTF